MNFLKKKNNMLYLWLSYIGVVLSSQRYNWSIAIQNLTCSHHAIERGRKKANNFDFSGGKCSWTKKRKGWSKKKLIGIKKKRLHNFFFTEIKQLRWIFSENIKMNMK